MSMRFRLLVGQHIEVDRTRKVGGDTRDPVTGKVVPVYAEKLYRAGEVIETDTDLDRMNGGGGMQRKFERLRDQDAYDTSPVAQAAQQGFETAFTDSGQKAPVAVLQQTPAYKREELDPLSEGELKSLAKEEGIDVGKATKKSDLIAAILTRK